MALGARPSIKIIAMTAESTDIRIARSACLFAFRAISLLSAAKLIAALGCCLHTDLMPLLLVLIQFIKAGSHVGKLSP